MMHVLLTDMIGLYNSGINDYRWMLLLLFFKHHSYVQIITKSNFDFLTPQTCQYILYLKQNNLHNSYINFTKNITNNSYI